MPPKKCNSFTLYAIGTILFLSGFVIIFMWPFIFEIFLKKNLALSATSKSYELWIKTPMPLYMEIYLFNWTNSNEFMQGQTKKPNLDEVGPFVFKEVHERKNIIWNTNHTVTYNETRTWHFVPELSVDLSIPVTNLNVVLMGITKTSSFYGTIIKELLHFLINIYKEKLIITRPASQWLFEGMNDSLLDFLRKTKVPVPFNKFGWFYGRNQSSAYDGVFNVMTGSDNIYNLGIMYKWNNQHKTQFFEGECGVVQGSTTELFPPLQYKQNNLSIFVSDFCGPLTLTYSELTTVNGLEGYRYIGDGSVFDNGTNYGSARCFCTGKCSPSGVRNETLCRKAPLFISFPHFYLADPLYLESVQGLKPNKNDHEFYLIINPLTGLPLEVRAQLQLNMLLEPISFFPIFSKVPKVYVPMMWFRQRIELPENLVSLGTELKLFTKIGLFLGCALIVISLILIIVGLLQQFFKSQTDELLLKSETQIETEPQLTDTEEN